MFIIRGLPGIIFLIFSIQGDGRGARIRGQMPDDRDQMGAVV
jgi:hypothetical protein